MILSFLFPRRVDSAIVGLEEAKNLAGKCPPPDSGPLSDAQFGKNLANLSKQIAASTDRGFEFQKCRQLFIRVHNETLPVRRDVRLQSRLFALWNQSLRPSPSSILPS
jgi:hypothetical protein